MRGRFALLLAIALSPLAVQLLKPSAPLLRDQDGARWIHARRQFATWAFRGGEKAVYRKPFHLAAAAQPAQLTVLSPGVVTVSIDGAPVERQTPPLAPGDHEVVAHVSAERGPALLLVACAPLGLLTGRDWEASFGGPAFEPVVLASEGEPFSVPARFETPFAAVRSLWPLYAALFALAFAWSLRPPLRLEPAHVRWGLLALWIALAVNDLVRLPLRVGIAAFGYDAADHYKYISYVANHWRVPLATQGAQMFQSPLYYLISAPLAVAFTRAGGPDVARRLLRIVPLACGVLQVQVAYRAARAVFPERRWEQIVTVVVGGLLPMSLYISQAVGNEPLEGFLAAAFIVALLELPAQAPLRRWAIAGALLGLAMLTKATAALLLLPLAVAAMRERPVHWRGAATALGAAFAICGWYYLRNWVALGTPFLGGWRSFEWWQDPGYRTPHDVLSFGAALVHPVYAAVHGFWDCVYSTLWTDGMLSGLTWPRPPWNYRPLLAGALWALVPACGIALGLARALAAPGRSAADGTMLCALAIVFYLDVLLALYLALPIYSTGKATYTLGLLPCYAVLCASGLAVAGRNRVVRAALNGALACWAVSAWLAYFVA